MPEAMLEVRDLVVHYGAIRALTGVSLSVPEGKVVCVIGSNGAGKTTTLRTVSGLLRPTSGTIVFNGSSIVGRPAHEIARLGVAHVPEGRHVFPDQSVEDNLHLGAFTRRGEGRAAIEADVRLMYDMFPRLGERRTQLAGTMSGGEQQMLAIGRALMLKPRLVLLDEPSMGLAPIVIDEVFRRLADLKGRGLTMLLVEQLAYRALDVADYAYVIEHGRIELEGPAATVRADPKVRAAYLGEGAG
ncbi:MAG: transporter ATP-binding protein [Gemmatimonadetes bacterium]|jgi:branched-chain amino acid transport system ATP-binding protein|nr:transporter ATP-binding protein [Gemmatimonadota bacterium]